MPVADTLKRVGRNHTIEETVPREGLWEAQTPQVFRRQLLLDAYAKRGGFAATDDAQLVERIGHPVTVVPGSPINLKITTQGRPATGRASAEGPAQAQADRPGASVRRRRHVAVSVAMSD